MQKRDFIKKLSLAALGTPLYASVLHSCMDEVAKTPASELASNEDFWLKV
jgi:hypothetical protein